MNENENLMNIFNGHMNMVNRISVELRRRVVELWLEGNNYREIHAKTGISLGTITLIIQEERTKVPDIEELRKLKVALLQAKATLPDALRGANFLERLNNLNIIVEKVPTCIELLTQYGEEAGQVLESARRLKEIETSQGKTYKQIVAEAAEKEKKLQELPQRIEDLRDKEKVIRESLEELYRLKELDGKMRSHGITLTRLDGIIEQGIKLEDLGFTPKVAEILASELAKKGLDPQKVATTLAKLFSEYKGLEETMAELLTERSRLQLDIEARRAEVDGLVRQKETVLSQLEAFRKQVDEYKHILERQEQIYSARLKQLEEEYVTKHSELEALHNEEVKKLNSQYQMDEARLKQKIQSLEGRREAIVKENQRLQGECMATQTSLNEAEAALKEIGEKVAEKRPLAALASLCEKLNVPIEPTLLFKVILGIVEGLKVHLAANPQLARARAQMSAPLEEIGRNLAEELRLETRKA